jgi:hypothetical protein
MKRSKLNIAVTGIVSLVAILASNRLSVVHGQDKKAPGTGFAAVPGQKGGQDVAMTLGVAIMQPSDRSLTHI